MKNSIMKNVMNGITYGLLLGTMACATTSQRAPASTAQYYRVWQGFQKDGLTSEKFMGELPSFMKETVDLYGNAKALNQYFVLIPPKNKPSTIPDELALVALNSEEDYQHVRATPEGTNYSERHWDVFQKGKSQSAKGLVDYTKEKPAKLESHLAYSMFSPVLDWTQGYTLAFIGARRASLDSKTFLTRLQSHIELAADKLKPFGLRGYIVIANENYEIAYLNWPSKKAHDLAFESEGGKLVFKDGGEFMVPVMYEPAFNLAAGETIDHGRFYKANPIRKKALIVVTSHSKLGSTGKKTGYYFPEAAHPYWELTQQSIQVDFASPRGGKAPMDPASLDLTDPVNKVLYADKSFSQKLDNTMKLSDVDASQYSAIVFAGGHGTMWDFRTSETVKKISAAIYDKGGVVAAVCHGPAALVDVRLADGSFLVDGKSVTGFTNEEEEAAGLTRVMPFLLEDALRARGGKFEEAPMWQKKVVVDGRLITGQNPASAAGVGQAVADQLK
jgi:putative intracellular protease/amidase